MSKMLAYPKRSACLRLEFALLFGGAPLLILAFKHPTLLFFALWAGALGALLFLRSGTTVSSDTKRDIGTILWRFALLAPLLTLASWWVWPTHFLELPRNKPGFWLLIMVLYPALSVWPQEVLYRSFLFSRYQEILSTPATRIVGSAVAFGFAHIIFQNWIAVILTTVGGFLFASGYERHHSLRLSWPEHSLYGCLIFTIGLGQFFYTGTAWRHH